MIRPDRNDRSSPLQQGGLPADTKISLSIAEAVKASGIGRTTIFDMIKTGRLPAKKLGARTIILCSDLEHFVANLPSRIASR